MITIENLEIQIDVEGDDDDQAFAEMFNRCIRQWAAEVARQKQTEKEIDKQGSLIEHSTGGSAW